LLTYFETLITGLYKETGNGSIGERLSSPAYKESVNNGLLEERTNNGRVQGEVMAGL